MAMSTSAENSTTVAFRISREQPSSSSCKMFSKRHIRFLFVFILMTAMAAVYVTLFQHPPPDELLRMNKKGLREFDFGAFGDNKEDNTADKRVKNRNYDSEDDDEIFADMIDGKDNTENGEDADDEDLNDDDLAAKPPPKKRDVKSTSVNGKLIGKDIWDQFIQQNGLTAIGVVFDRCEKPTEQLGTVVMLPDQVFGGVKSRTYYNFTLDADLEGGKFYMEVKYNGQDLYDNWWELCEMEEELPPENRTFFCPIRKGKQALIKDKHIPSYLPKGHYQSKAWVIDEQGKLLVCGFSDFVL